MHRVCSDRIIVVGSCIAAVLVVGTVVGCTVSPPRSRRSVQFQGFDQVGTPGRDVALTVSLRTSGFIRSLPDYTVLFFDGPAGKRSARQRIGAAKTDVDGIARITRRFATTGLHVVHAELDPAELHSSAVPTCDLVVGIFQSTQPFVVVDLDHTIVDAGLDEVLLGDPDPLPDAAAVLGELAQQHQVLYLTHRPEFLRSRSKAFLRKWGFPEAPLLMSTLEEWASGSESFKSGELERLLALFPNIKVGVGDKITDGVAYCKHGLTCFLIVQPEVMTSEQRRVLADALDVLDDRAQVVTSWSEIRRALAGAAVYSRQAMQERLRKADAP